MKPSPLLLDRHCFSKIELRCNESGEIGAFNQISTKVEAGQAMPPTDPELLKFWIPHYRVALTVRLLPSEGNVPFYTGEFVAVGFFRVRPDYPADKSAKLVAVTGASMLYGAIREMVANLTARGPAPMLNLVSVSFNDTPIQEDQKLCEVVEAKAPHGLYTRRKRGSPAEPGVKSAQNTFGKVLRKADPNAAKR